MSIAARAIRVEDDRQPTTGGTHMRKIVVTEFMSLDGVMEEPRWTFDFDRGPEGDQFKYEELFDAGSLLLGRVTYQGFAAAWPGMGGDDFGQRMNGIHKYVVSGTLAPSEATWGDTSRRSRTSPAATCWSRAAPSWCTPWPSTGWSMSTG
jgi:hypothetical protein